MMRILLAMAVLAGVGAAPASAATRGPGISPVSSSYTRCTTKVVAVSAWPWPHTTRATRCSVGKVVRVARG